MASNVACFYLKNVWIKSLFVLLVLSINMYVGKAVGRSGTAVSSNVDMERISLSSGLQLAVAKTPAVNYLKQWAKELDDAETKVSYEVAVRREREVVAAIDNGLWPEEVYIEYQKLAASTGNVDSARLLVRYGVDSVIDTTASLPTPVGKFHHSVMYCKGEQFLDLYDTGIDLESSAADGSTTPLITAAYSGCLPIVSLLISEDVNVDAVGQHGMNALMVSSSVGNAEAVGILLEDGGADVNAKHKFAGSTALHFAAEMNHEDVIKTLCEYGADANIPNDIGITPLHIASHSGSSVSIGAIARYCRYDVDIITHIPPDQEAAIHDSYYNNATPLFLAAQSGHATAINALAELGANVHFRLPVLTSSEEEPDDLAFLSQIEFNFDSEGLIQDIAENYGESDGAVGREGIGVDGLVYDTEDNVDIREDLQKRLAEEKEELRYDPNANVRLTATREKVGNSEKVLKPSSISKVPSVMTGYYAQPIHIAAENGHADAIVELLAYGADINSMSMGLTPLHLAASKNRPEALKVLLENNAKVDVISELDGSTALFIACGQGYDVIVRLLLKYGADTSIRNVKTGAFPLLHATVNNKMQIVRMLLHDGHADANEATPDGWRAVHIAAMNGYLATLNTLAVHRANMFATGPDNMTPFHFAAMNGHENALVELLHLLKTAPGQSRYRGVLDIARESDGSTALHIVSRKGDYMCVRRLLKAGANVHVRMRDDVGFGASPLYLAAQSSNVYVIKLLLMAGANPDVELTNIGSTPLLTAVERNDVEVVSVLLEGVLVESDFTSGDSEKIDNDGSAHHIAAAANPNKGIVTHEASKSPLILAILHGMTSIAELLLDYGADCNVKFMVKSNKIDGGKIEEFSTMQLAAMKNNQEMMELLYNHEACSEVVNNRK